MLFFLVRTKVKKNITSLQVSRQNSSVGTKSKFRILNEFSKIMYEEIANNCCIYFFNNTLNTKNDRVPCFLVQMFESVRVSRDTTGGVLIIIDYTLRWKQLPFQLPTTSISCFLSYMFHELSCLNHKQLTYSPRSGTINTSYVLFYLEWTVPKLLISNRLGYLVEKQSVLLWIEQYG